MRFISLLVLAVTLPPAKAFQSPLATTPFQTSSVESLAALPVGDDFATITSHHHPVSPPARCGKLFLLMSSSLESPSPHQVPLTLV